MRRLEMGREAQSVLLLLVGAALLRLAVGETYLRYVKTGMRPLLLAAAVVLLLLGGVSLLRETFAPATAERGHAHGPAVAWLLVLPVLAVLLVAPPALGSYAAHGRNTAPAPDAVLPPLPQGSGPATLTLGDYVARAFADGGSTLRGRQVRLLGFASVRPGGGYYLTRFTLSCCAADARSIRVAVVGDAVPRPSDSWLEVVGTVTAASGDDARQYVPTVRADDVRPVAAPRQPYE